MATRKPQFNSLHLMTGSSNHDARSQVGSVTEQPPVTKDTSKPVAHPLMHDYVPTRSPAMIRYNAAWMFWRETT